ncbi:MAG: recombinase family protein [Actinomycetota bacterium]
MRVLGYLRVSLDSEVGKVMSRQDQERSLRETAHANGWKLIGIHIDQGRSASGDLSTRVALSTVLDGIRSHEADAMVVARWDRLGPDQITQQLVAEIVDRMGGHIFSCDMFEVGDLAVAPRDPSLVQIREAIRAGMDAEADVRRMRVRGRVGRPQSERERLEMIRLDNSAGSPPIRSSDPDDRGLGSPGSRLPWGRNT